MSIRYSCVNYFLQWFFIYYIVTEINCHTLFVMLNTFWISDNCQINVIFFKFLELKYSYLNCANVPGCDKMHFVDFYLHCRRMYCIYLQARDFRHATELQALLDLFFNPEDRGSMIFPKHKCKNHQTRHHLL